MPNNNEKPERLDKILSNAGYGARSEVKKFIRSGAVSCDGTVVIEPDAKFLPLQTRIDVNGISINYRKFVYLMLHKPKGVVSSTDDPGHATVADLVSAQYGYRKLFPVGRLDIDATGLLLMTDDGELAHRLISPARGVEKEYEVMLDAPPGPEAADDFAKGVTLHGNLRLKPAKLTDLHEMQCPVSTDRASETPGPETSPEPRAESGSETSPEPHAESGSKTSPVPRAESGPETSPEPRAESGSGSTAERRAEPRAKPYVARVVVTEGKYHQIKRMFAAYGAKVLELKRLRMGGLSLDPALSPGEFRELTPQEIANLHKIASTGDL